MEYGELLNYLANMCYVAFIVVLVGYIINLKLENIKQKEELSLYRGFTNENI